MQNRGKESSRLANLHLGTALALTTRRRDTARKSTIRNMVTSRQPEYRPVKAVGKGAFGVVYCARSTTGELVAIKKVKQDPRYQNREYDILRMLQNRHCVSLKNAFKSFGQVAGEVYLNLVMEYFPSSLCDVVTNYRKNGKYPPLFFVKLFGFQIFAGLRYLKSMGICHRDIKPENILVDVESGELKICDFGSAKIIQHGESSVSYIASRYYRAPELLFGCQTYTTAIDVWSAGCVIAEMLMAGTPIFPGASSVGQITEIAKVIGPPSQEDLDSFEHSEDTTVFPKQVTSLKERLPPHTPPDLLDLLEKIFIYNPVKRPDAQECLNHPFFDDLFKGGVTMQNGRPLPVLER